jgi:hypothetical protein
MTREDFFLSLEGHCSVTILAPTQDVHIKENMISTLVSKRIPESNALT